MSFHCHQVNFFTSLSCTDCVHCYTGVHVLILLRALHANKVDVGVENISFVREHAQSVEGGDGGIDMIWKCGELKLYFSPSAGGEKKDLAFSRTYNEFRRNLRSHSWSVFSFFII